jgi:biotin operon repressor
MLQALADSLHSIEYLVSSLGLTEQDAWATITENR